MRSGRTAKRRPTSPGEILAAEFLLPLGISHRELANHIGHDVKVIHRIVNGRSSITAKIALELAAALRTSPDFWLDAQRAVDLYEARQALGKLPGPLPAMG